MIQKSAAEMAAALAAKEVSSVELTQAHLDRIAAVDDDVKAFLHVDSEGALAQAAAVDADRASGKTLAPLAGIPLALKDVLAQKGVPTTAGSRILEGWRPPYDTTCDWFRYRWIYSPTGSTYRHRRCATNIWRSFSLRPDRLLIITRSSWTIWSHRSRYCAFA